MIVLAEPAPLPSLAPGQAPVASTWSCSTTNPTLTGPGSSSCEVRSWVLSRPPGPVEVPPVEVVSRAECGTASTMACAVVDDGPTTDVLAVGLTLLLVVGGLLVALAVRR